MKIVISDYDGTLANRTGLLGDVVSAVTEWRDAGNRFGIATGRDLPMILAETEKWGIPYDFLICISGAAIYDHDNTLLDKRFLREGVVPELLRHPASLASLHCCLSGLGPLRIVLREGSWMSKIGVPFEEVTLEQALALENLGQLSLAFHSIEECEKWSAMLERDFAGKISVHPNKITIDINAPGVDKANGIETLLSLKGWDDSKLFVIGDGGNDVGMIERFSGFTVPNADPAAERTATRVFRHVPDMLASL